MKKILVLMSIVLLAVSIIGCAKEKVNPLPFGLEFGQSEDGVMKAFTEEGLEAPEIKKANANNSYFGSAVGISFENLKKHFGLTIESDDIFLEAMIPSYSVSLNQDKKLYEFYLIMDVSFLKEETKQQLVDDFIRVYTEKLGDQSAEPDGAYAKWVAKETEISIFESDGKLVITIHSYEYDLNSVK